MKTDISPVAVDCTTSRQTRVPLKFGPETTSVIARVRVTVTDGMQGRGLGETR
jgi:hypothetical protein